MEMQLGFPADSNFIGSMVHPRAVAIFAIVCILRFALLESIFVTAGGVYSHEVRQVFFLKVECFHL